MLRKFGLGAILPGVGQAFAETYNALMYNEDLHQGAAEGFYRAGKVAVLAHSFVAAKTLLVEGAAYVATQAPVMWYGTGSYHVQKTVIDGLKVTTPTGFTAKVASKATLWALSPPPWQE